MHLLKLFCFHCVIMLLLISIVYVLSSPFTHLHLFNSIYYAISVIGFIWSFIAILSRSNSILRFSVHVSVHLRNSKRMRLYWIACFDVLQPGRILYHIFVEPTDSEIDYSKHWIMFLIHNISINMDRYKQYKKYKHCKSILYIVQCLAE